MIVGRRFHERADNRRKVACRLHRFCSSCVFEPFGQSLHAKGIDQPFGGLGIIEACQQRTEHGFSSLYQRGRSTLKRDTPDVGTAHKQRNILRCRLPADMFFEIFGDLRSDCFERQERTLDLANEANEMNPIAAFDGRRYLADGKLNQCGFEFRCRISQADLPEAATDLAGGTVGTVSGQFGKALRLAFQSASKGGHSLARLGEGVGILPPRCNQDMIHLEKRRRHETLAVIVIEATQRLLVCRRRLHFPLEERTQQRVFVGFDAPLGIGLWLDEDAQAPRLLQKQMANDERSRCGMPRSTRIVGREILRLGSDVLAGDRHAIDADRRHDACPGRATWLVIVPVLVLVERLCCGTVDDDGNHGSFPRMAVGTRRMAPSIEAAPHDLIAGTPEIPDRCTPDMDQAGKRKQQEDRHAEQQVRFEDGMHVSDVGSGSRLQRQNALRPVHELYHLMTVHMVERDGDGGEAQRQLQP
ncbi:hypothetical protein RHSP_54667 [Rhizobium freirei PRF 81]|uniref:Uncharacterized protein n=1 Tax=Rhizobium freirei PRF 81 TaxID=363754 RepID=N6U4K3_9HYPH|nr:hypothetical protein RHSP_54667 [Rhizobium freirei PRF 81]